MNTVIDIKVLEDYRIRKLIKYRKHPSKDLLIWNYTEIVQMKALWDDVTTRTRGLITDSQGNIIAHSFKKFHNIEQNLHKPSAEFSVYEKMDGSLGILFWYDNEWIICSRGSFESDQAQEANKMLEKYNLSQLDKNLAYSFEIIYPTNRIVVDYKDFYDLVFLAAFNKEGEDVDVNDTIKAIGFPMAKEYQYTDYKSIQQLNIENAEGFVVKFHGTGDRTKIKFEDYVKMHRSVTNLSSLSVWTLFGSGKTLEEVINNIPDEVFPWFKQNWEHLSKSYDKILKTVNNIYLDITKTKMDKAAFASIVKDNYPEYQHLLFKIYQLKNEHDNNIKENNIEVAIRKIINNMIKPREIYTPFNDPSQSDKKEPKKITQEVIIMIGISGSGKSTKAKEILDSNPKYIRVNRDTIRMMLYGYTEATLADYYLNLDITKEQHVTIVEMDTIKTFLSKGYSVVLDDTNIQKKIINEWVKNIHKDFPSVNIRFELLDTPNEDCISRDASRIKSIGEKVINKQATRLKSLKKIFDFKPINGTEVSEVKPFIQNENLPKAVVCDLDGTLCIMSDRSPFDCTRVEEDTLCVPVKNTLSALHKAGYHIILVTGRTAEALEGSKRWLKKYNVNYHEIHCRRKGDFRKDFVIKEEIWIKLIKKYYIEFMLDDRQQVVDHARNKGFKVFQVEPNTF